MDPDSHDSVIKRPLEGNRDIADGEVQEKRPRLESGISDISDVVRDEVPNVNASDVDEQEETNATEVIYELSPDHNESLLSPSVSPSAQDVSPKDRKSPKGDKVIGKELEHNRADKSGEERGSSDEEEDGDKEEVKENKVGQEASEESEVDSDESSSSSSSDEEEDTSENNEDQKESSEQEDSEDNKDTGEQKGTEGKPDVEMLTDDETENARKAVEKVNSENKRKTSSQKPTVPQQNSDISDDESVAKPTSNQEKALGKSDYSKKSVEDLEYLQEDLHKELAQITEESLQRKKHKKTSSSGHREKRAHKDKSSSRHKEREHAHARDHYRKENPDARRKYRDDPSRPRESKHRTEKPAEKRERPEKAPQPEKTPPYKRIVTVATAARRPEAVENGGKKKGLMSDSMREMIRAGVKEIKVERPKDLRGLNTEVMESESDDSPERDLLVATGETSDVSPAESEEDSEPEKSPIVPKLPPYLPGVRGCRNVEEFQWLNRIEEGTYGVVYRAKDKRTGEIVALKKLKMEKEKEGFPITSLREINTLLKSQHPNIVTVQEIVVGSNMDKIYIVMDFVEHDLKALMETMTQSFLAGEIKTIMIQLLRAVNHLHDNWILHRDIKTSNLLLSNKGILKVGDFGLAREYGSPLKPYTPIVVTLWYRAPELLLGAKEYSTPIDMWSVGCVFAELLTMKPLFNGQSEISQINKIFKELGTPSDKIWPGPPAYSELPATKKMTFAEYPYNNLRNRFGATLTDNGFDLLNSFLTYDPKRRITADAALKHQYFNESPSPVDPSMFPSWPARSEGAKRAKKASPKAPEGGNFYKTLSGDGDGAFHIPAGKSQGSSAVSGFTLKF